MLDIVGIAPSHSPHAYANSETGAPTTTMPAVSFAHHHFSATPDGQLQHAIDGHVRATVPPEGWADYVKAWPDAQKLVSQLERKARRGEV
jgi:hypothetical protein